MNADLVKLLAKYSDDQERDDHGRWVGHPEKGLFQKIIHQKETGGFKLSSGYGGARTVSHHVEFKSPGGAHLEIKSSQSSQNAPGNNNRVRENGKTVFNEVNHGKMNAMLRDRYGVKVTGKGFDNNTYGY